VQSAGPQDATADDAADASSVSESESESDDLERLPLATSDEDSWVPDAGNAGHELDLNDLDDLAPPGASEGGSGVGNATGMHDTSERATLYELQAAADANINEEVRLQRTRALNSNQRALPAGNVSHPSWTSCACNDDAC
jgi:hypothetical protein